MSHNRVIIKVKRMLLTQGRNRSVYLKVNKKIKCKEKLIKQNYLFEGMNNKKNRTRKVKVKLNEIIRLNVRDKKN